MSIRRRRSTISNGSADSTTKAVERKLEDSLLVWWDDLPAWLQDNHFIHGGYRPASGSFFKSFASLGYLHNESVNIYTHLVGAVSIVLLCGVLHNYLAPRYATASTADAAAFGCFFVGAAFCLGMSATYHTISNHSHEVACFGNKLDYVGIVFLTTGSFVGITYYGFFCKPILQRTYWIMISTLGLGCTGVSIIPKFRTPQWRPFRASMFVAMGLSGVFPVLHGLSLYGFEELNRQMGLSWVIWEGFLYILGAAIYAARVPESVRPGSHDLWGSSHQIFHVLVLMAAASHLVAMVKAFDHNHGINGLKCW